MGLWINKKRYEFICFLHTHTHNRKCACLWSYMIALDHTHLNKLRFSEESSNFIYKKKQKNNNNNNNKYNTINEVFCCCSYTFCVCCVWLFLGSVCLCVCVCVFGMPLGDGQPKHVPYITNPEEVTVHKMYTTQHNKKNRQDKTHSMYSLSMIIVKGQTDFQE